MSYDNKQLQTIVLPSWDYGDGNTVDTVSFRGPTGKKGRLKKVGIMVQETFADDQTAAKFEVGTAADPDAYALLSIADAAADVDCFDETDDTDAIIAEDIPADTLVQLKGTAGTDSGTAAGKGLSFVVIEWY